MKTQISEDHNKWPTLKTYEGEYLRRIKMPIGGVGTGTVSLAGNGELVDWEIRGMPDMGYVPGVDDRAFATSGFWLRTEDETGNVCGRLLAGPIDTMNYEGAEGTRMANHGFPRFSGCRFSAAYPLAQVELDDMAVPVKASLEAMNPLIPGDLAASSIPAALYRWHIENTSQHVLTVSIYGLLASPVAGEIFKSSIDGSNIVQGVTIGSVDEQRHNRLLGSVALTVPSYVEDVSTAVSLADSGWMVRMDRIWKKFMSTGRAENCLDAMASREYPAVAVAVQFQLAPGESRKVPFILSWRFPHRHAWVNWSYRPKSFDSDFDEKFDIGNHYATVYHSAVEAAEDMVEHLDDYERRTIDFVNGVLSHTAPDVVKEAALFNLSTLRTETCFRCAKGHFYGWEGVFEHEGSCYGNCTHVWGYEHALVDLWPELAKDMTESQFGPQMDQETGHISFRVGLPLNEYARTKIAAADGQMQCIIKAYENWKKTADDEWMKELYPRVRKGMEYCWIDGGWDCDRDGVMEGCQHNTMDVDYYGPNPQMEFLYIAALKAMAEMASFAGDPCFAECCLDLATRGSNWTETNLFNGLYYRHIVMPPNGKIAEGTSSGSAGDQINPAFQLADGCLIDQLLGDYASRHIGLGPVADERNSRIALDTILAKCSSANVGATYNCGRDYAFPEEPSLKMAWYPEGSMPEKPFPYYGENMTGFEYVVAANLAQRGDFATAEKVVRDVRARYDGRKRNPFDEAECGHHYVRAMAAWTVLSAFK